MIARSPKPSVRSVRPEVEVGVAPRAVRPAESEQGEGEQQEATRGLGSQELSDGIDDARHAAVELGGHLSEPTLRLSAVRREGWSATRFAVPEPNPHWSAEVAVAVATFLIALALIASERLHRTKVALLGAAIVVLFAPGFGQEKAIEAVDFNTIGLLAGMMILVYLTQQSGVYDYIAIRAGQLSRGKPLLVVLSLAGTTALLSAFLDNLTTILLVVPDHLPARRRARHRPDPADRDRGDRLQHRRDRDPDRRPAQHHHRRRDRPHASTSSSSTSRRSSSSRSRSSIAGLYLFYRRRLQIEPREPAPGDGARRERFDPRLRRAAPDGPRPRSAPSCSSSPTSRSTSSRPPSLSPAPPSGCW